jgi:hypothetical protein
MSQEEEKVESESRKKKRSIHQDQANDLSANNQDQPLVDGEKQVEE